MRTAAPLLAFALLCACAVPPPERPSSLRAQVPVSLESAGLGVAPWPAQDWWQRYDDPLLSQLVERALSGAPRIATAAARIEAARQQVRVAGASQGLQVDLKAQYERLRLSDHGLLPTEFLGFNWYNQADLGLDIRYQLDWWGRKQALVEAALDRAHAAQAEQRAATLSLSAAVAQEYFGWQTDAARIALTQQRLQIIESQRQLAARRVAARLESTDYGQQLDLQRATATEALAQLQTSQRLRVVALAALVGGSAEELPPLQPHPLPSLSVGLPERVGIDLLSRRPDIVASRWRIAAAQRDTDEVRASYYPDISLHALAGLSSIELGKLLSAGSAAPRLGAAVNLPLFDGGLRDARHGAAAAALTEAVAEYNTAVVDAARELGAAAQRVQGAQAQRAAREQAQHAALTLLDSARARLAGGLTHRGPELDAQLALLSAQDSLLQNDYERMVADVQLNQALGGGYVDQETLK
jgi:multidrug efflux system outer membrane protein